MDTNVGPVWDLDPQPLAQIAGSLPTKPPDLSLKISPKIDKMNKTDRKEVDDN